VEQVVGAFDRERSGGGPWPASEFNKLVAPYVFTDEDSGSRQRAEGEARDAVVRVGFQGYARVELHARSLEGTGQSERGLEPPLIFAVGDFDDAELRKMWSEVLYFEQREASLAQPKYQLG